MNCQYCGMKFVPDCYGMCSRCGARKPEPITIHKYDPFFYDGFIVYALRDLSKDCIEFVFYKGTDLTGKVNITHREMSENVPGYCDHMPYVMEKLNKELST